MGLSWWDGTVRKREWTGTGVYVYYSLPRGVVPASKSAAILDDVRLVLSRDISAGAILHIKNGKIESLECLRDDGGEWPREPEIQTLDYYGSEVRDVQYVRNRLGESSSETPPKFPIFKMEVGKIYNVVFSTGRYEIEYENDVKCIKKTPMAYRVERQDGTTRLVGQGAILELKEVRKDPPPNHAQERTAAGEE